MQNSGGTEGSPLRQDLCAGVYQGAFSGGVPCEGLRGADWAAGEAQLCRGDKRGLGWYPRDLAQVSQIGARALDLCLPLGPPQDVGTGKESSLRHGDSLAPRAGPREGPCSAPSAATVPCLGTCGGVWVAPHSIHNSRVGVRVATRPKCQIHGERENSWLSLG